MYFLRVCTTANDIRGFERLYELECLMSLMSAVFSKAEFARTFSCPQVKLLMIQSQDRNLADSWISWPQALIDMIEHFYFRLCRPTTGFVFLERPAEAKTFTHQTKPAGYEEQAKNTLWAKKLSRLL